MTTRIVLGLLGTLAAASAAELTTAPATFAKDVAPILQEKCQGCHRAGSMAPMSLVTYEETRPWAKSMKQRVVTRSMPWLISSRKSREPIPELPRRAC